MQGIYYCYNCMKAINPVRVSSFTSPICQFCHSQNIVEYSQVRNGERSREGPISIQRQLQTLMNMFNNISMESTDENNDSDENNNNNTDYEISSGEVDFDEYSEDNDHSEVYGDEEEEEGSDVDSNYSNYSYSDFSIHSNCSNLSDYYDYDDSDDDSNGHWASELDESYEEKEDDDDNSDREEHITDADRDDDNSEWETVDEDEELDTHDNSINGSDSDDNVIDLAGLLASAFLSEYEMDLNDYMGTIMEIGRNGSVYRVMTPSLSNIFTDNNSENDDNVFIQGEITLEHQGNRNNIMSTFIRLRHIIRSQFPQSAQPNHRPATRESIEKLKQRILMDGDSLIKSGTECIICQDIYEINKFVTKLPCGHEYHQECIIHWLNQSSTCPICRQSIDDTETTT